MRAAALSAKWGINLLYHPTKALTFLYVVDTGYEWIVSTFQPVA